MAGGDFCLFAKSMIKNSSLKIRFVSKHWCKIVSFPSQEISVSTLHMGKEKREMLSSISRLFYCQGSLINLKALIYTSFFSLRTSFQPTDQNSTIFPESSWFSKLDLFIQSKDRRHVKEHNLSMNLYLEII